MRKNKFLTICSTMDAVTARDSDHSTPRRARQSRDWGYRIYPKAEIFIL